MYEHKIAYRFMDGEPDMLEGFVGTGSTKRAAELDAREQIKRKIAIMEETRKRLELTMINYQPGRIITSPSRLTPEELALVQADWRSGVRY